MQNLTYEKLLWIQTRVNQIFDQKNSDNVRLIDMLHSLSMSEILTISYLDAILGLLVKENVLDIKDVPYDTTLLSFDSDTEEEDYNE